MDEKEFCKVCHKKQVDTIIIDSNPLSMAMYFEMKERWDKEGICIKCQEKEVEPEKVHQKTTEDLLKENDYDEIEVGKIYGRQEALAEVMSVLDGWFSENMYEDDNYSDKKPKPKIIKMMKIDKVKEEIKSRLEGKK